MNGLFCASSVARKSLHSCSMAARSRYRTSPIAVGISRGWTPAARAADLGPSLPCSRDSVRHRRAACASMRRRTRSCASAHRGRMPPAAARRCCRCLCRIRAACARHVPARPARLRQAAHPPARRDSSANTDRPAPPDAAGCRCAWSECAFHCVAWRFLPTLSHSEPTRDSPLSPCPRNSCPQRNPQRYASTSGPRPIAAIVAGLSCPFGCRPRPCWNRSIAAWVPPPQTPSTAPL